jgi:hypothetical protein
VPGLKRGDRRRERRVELRAIKRLA